ncbi:hypothetical protein TSUD_155360 [Trifolium subterraneum]|uniref:Uncharacterized protein n=1 Tax=Trifolium subterraneum TaxID=3900 RepID=A0A2Z6NHS7_TRISU|nr:hypothetical protein TSUD_155360 [Trifolium subterraneum]
MGLWDQELELQSSSHGYFRVSATGCSSEVTGVTIVTLDRHALEKTTPSGPVTCVSPMTVRPSWRTRSMTGGVMGVGVWGG